MFLPNPNLKSEFSRSPTFKNQNFILKKVYITAYKLYINYTLTKFKRHTMVQFDIFLKIYSGLSKHSDYSASKGARNICPGTCPCPCLARTLGLPCGLISGSQSYHGEVLELEKWCQQLLHNLFSFPKDTGIFFKNAKPSMIYFQSQGCDFLLSGIREKITHPLSPFNISAGNCY